MYISINNVCEMNMKKILQEDVKVKQLLRPETELEHRLIEQPEFYKGLLWGKPRFGHPEGAVLYHIREVLDNVDKLDISPEERTKLRLITFVHDTFKYCEDKNSPRDWTKHHAVYARHFLAKFYDEAIVLDIVELHDEAYYVWRLDQLYNEKEKAQERLDKFLSRISDNIQLYYLFFVCDTRTGDKIQAPLTWFEKTFSLSKLVKI